MGSETDDGDPCTWPSAPERQEWLALQALSVTSSLLSMYTNMHDVQVLT